MRASFQRYRRAPTWDRISLVSEYKIKHREVFFLTGFVIQIFILSFEFWMTIYKCEIGNTSAWLSWRIALGIWREGLDHPKLLIQIECDG